MVIRIVMLLLVVMSFAAEPLRADAWGKSTRSKPEFPQTIKVLIVQDSQGVVIETKGKYRLFDPKTNERISTRFIGKRKFIQALTDGLQWGEEFPGLHQLQIVPDTQGITTVVDGIEYRGAITVYDVCGLVNVVNEVDVEDFLQSTLAPCFRDPQPSEALAALAIAARTDAYYLAQNPCSPFWAIDARTAGYQGYAVTHCNSMIEPAIQATRYLIMSKGVTPEGRASAFPVQWGQQVIGKFVAKATPSKVSVSEADQMAQKGNHAAQILTKAFPDTTIVLMYAAQPKK